MSDAGRISCPSCGAPVRFTPRKPGPDGPVDSHCTHCHTRLATVACEHCFAMMFDGSRFCPHCGGKHGRGPDQDIHVGGCPRCDEHLRRTTVGSMPMSICGKCAGIWIDAATFSAIVEDRARSAPSVEAQPTIAAVTAFTRQRPYLKCPTCRDFMNRQNFARRSGVVVDQCTAHGLWLDHEEFREIVEFIRGGGLVKAERNEAERTRHRQAAERLARLDEQSQRGQALTWSDQFGNDNTGSVAGLVADVLRALL